MQNFLALLRRKHKQIIRHLFFVAAIIIIVFAIPKTGKFKYEFEKGKPWLHEDLIAPFSFPIEKSPEEIEAERKAIQENFKPFYTLNGEVEKNEKKEFDQAIQKSTENESEAVEKKLPYLKKKGLQLLSQVYSKGIIELAEQHQEKPTDFRVTLVTNKVAEDRSLNQLYTVKQAHNFLLQQIEDDTLLNKPYFISPLFSAVENNIIYDQQLSEKRLQELIDNISLTRGLVQENEKIISKGNIVTPEKYQILVSLKKEYETRISRGENIEIFGGYFMVITLLFVLYIVYLHLFEPILLRTNRNVILILVNIIIFILMGIYVTNNPSLNVYLIPYCILPIVLLAFFGSRAAFLSFILVILITGIFAPNAYEFILIQTMAGLTAVLTMLRIRYISQFFISTILIFASYLLAYLAINFIQGIVVAEIPYMNFLWFGGNFILTLLAYPLIYAYEKMFGLLSDITLIELSDINRRLLRKLALKAPGTFQHSLQVSNMAETLISEIGGDPLLTRVGALYHDIGKMENPAYFIENQKFMKNPHDFLDAKESAQIIIRHVTKGEEMARNYGLPEKIIDFIKTHHGTSRVEYFYQNYLKASDSESVDESDFRYPGPKPTAKEHAVVMMVDSVEAASRSLKQIEEGTLEKLVDKIIDQKINDNQLEEADLTMKEINHIRYRLKRLLKTIYHVRVEYPEVEMNKKS